MKTILVIDKDNSTRKNICNFLEDEGYNVLSAKDGFTGLQLAISNLPNLILCEILIPEMNGFDFFKTIQQIESTSAIPLIFVTAKCEKEDFRTGMNMGADDYITKPFEFNELLESIKTRFNKFEKYQQNNNDKFHALINNPTTGVFIYNKNKFDYINEKCAKIFGLSSADFSKNSFNDLIIGNDKNTVLKKIEYCLNISKSNIHIFFKVLKAKEKHEITIEMFAGFVNYNGVNSLIGYMKEYAKAKNTITKIQIPAY